MRNKGSRSERKQAASDQKNKLSIFGSGKPRQDVPKDSSNAVGSKDQDFDETDFLIRKAMDEKRGSFKKPPKPVYDSWNLPEENSVKPPETHAGKGPKGYRRPDERIWEDVCEALLNHPEIDASEIEVEVKDGIVIFKGKVESRLIKRMAEDLVEDIAGVTDVQNDLHFHHNSNGNGNGKKDRKESKH
jgi:hypothetical protein